MLTLATSTPGGHYPVRDFRNSHEMAAVTVNGTPGGHSGTSSNAQGFALRRGADVGIRSGQGLRLVQGATVQALYVGRSRC